MASALPAIAAAATPVMIFFIMSNLLHAGSAWANAFASERFGIRVQLWRQIAMILNGSSVAARRRNFGAGAGWSCSRRFSACLS
jgi:hypothetical protein